MGLCGCHKASPVLHNTKQFHEEYIPTGTVREIVLPSGDTVYLDEANGTYFLGDIIFSQEQIATLSTADTKGAVLTSPIQRWSGTIWYYIKPGFTSSTVAAIHSGINMVSSAVLSIKFLESSTPISSYGIVFQPSTNTNNSPYGRTSLNTINIVYNELTPGVVAHEILHSLGYFHEQSRTDRDSYVTINSSNIMPGKEHNFKTFSQLGYSATNVAPYDYSSIMHYGSWDFSIDGVSPTIVKTTGATFYSQRTHLTTNDLKALDRYYGVILSPERQFCGEDRNETFTSLDLTTWYANCIVFRDVDGNTAPLPFDATIRITLHTYQMDPEHPNGFTNDDSFIVNVSAGSSFYNNLVMTKDIIRESYGTTTYLHEETFFAERIN